MPNRKTDNELITQRIRKVRKDLGLRQEDFAKRIGLDQTTISKWETGNAKPTPDAMVKLASVSEGIDKIFFLEHAGLPAEFFDGHKMIPDIEEAAEKVVSRAFEGKGLDPVWVPLFHDSVAAGEPRNIQEEIEEWIPFSKKLIPHGSKLRALKVAGDSMSPIVNDGYVVIIDAAQQDPRKLVGKMVAAREGDGVTIKWLRRDKDTFLLVPQHVSLKIPVRIMRQEDNWSIVGVVIKWIGYPLSVGK